MFNNEINLLEKKLISPKNRFKLSKKNEDEIKKIFFKSNTVIIGCAGSIGFEFTKSLKHYKFKSLFLIDKDENRLTDLNRELITIFDKTQIYKTRYICCDINHIDFNSFLIKNKISHILNFSAVKHVRSEHEILSSKYLFETNSMKFLNLGKINNKYLKQVFSISTDKVVEPSSFLGISKSIMEDRIFKFKQNNKKINVSTVRFANVSFSNGSILKYALERIKERKIFGVPEKISRFFITHEEAISLCKKSLLRKSDNHIIVPNLKFIENSLNLVELIKSLLKFYKFKITSDKKLHLKKNYFYVKQTPSTITGQKLYEKLYEEDEKIFFDDDTKHIFVKKNKKKIKIDLILNQLLKANSIKEIKKLIKKNYKNYIINNKNFNIKNSL